MWAKEASGALIGKAACQGKSQLSAVVTEYIYTMKGQRSGHEYIMSQDGRNFECVSGIIFPSPVCKSQLD